MNISTYLIAVLAGLLTTLSPCVLPVLPLVLASSLRAGKRGPLFFVAGLLVTFVGVTWVISSFGTILGLDRSFIRNFSGVALLLAGLLFLSEKAQAAFSKILSPLVDKVSRTTNEIGVGHQSNWEGSRQFILGALTGIIWTPCSGPSLGIAIGLAADRQNALNSLLLLFVFGLGSAIPILAIAYGSAAFTKRLKEKSSRHAAVVKKSLGLLIVVFGLGILTGFDKKIEAVLVNISPEWLSDLTTRF